MTIWPNFMPNFPNWPTLPNPAKSINPINVLKCFAAINTLVKMGL